MFVDTGAFFARYRKSDEFHAVANYGWRRVAVDRTACFTTDLVVAEALTLFGREFGSQVAADRAKAIYNSDYITIFRPVQEDEVLAIELLRKYADQPIHFVDCVSFVMMRKHKLKRVFGFDRHFETAGFELWPKK